jgi:hypothetical protein
MTGFVDLGYEDVSNDEAKEVLVFLVVGTVGHWKTPVAYYCTRSLTADVQKELILQTVDALKEIGLQVVALVMDGLATNFTMCNLLGWQLDFSRPLKTWFTPTSSNCRIYVILDACHMQISRWMEQQSNNGSVYHNFQVTIGTLWSKYKFFRKCHGFG